MKLLTKLLLGLFLIFAGYTSAQDPWINEIHYDNTGTDSGEGFEIAGLTGLDLSCYQVMLYRPSDSTVYNTISLSGLIGDDGCGYGAIWFGLPTNGLQNGTVGIALYYDASIGGCGGVSHVVQFLSYEGTMVANNGPAVGMTSDDIGVQEGSGTAVGFSMQLEGTGSSYGDFTWAAPTTATTNALNGNQFISPCGTLPTTTITGLNSSSYTIDCSGPTSASGSITFTTDIDYNAGNTFTIQLSDASGSFVTPLTIGSVAGISGTTTSFTIPADIPAGSGYQIQIVTDNPGTVSVASSSFTVTQNGSCTPPHLTSVIINSCQDGTCPEGNNEIVFGNTGDYSLEVTPTNFDLGYGTAATILTDNYTESLTTNPATTALLNDSAGCPGLFVEGTGETLPPNASFLVVSNALCVDALIWSSLCGAGPIYVIYTTDPTWGSSGNFSNSASGIRYFDLNTISTGGGVFNEDYDFNSNDLTLHADGDYVTFPANGGSALEYGNNGCTIDPVLLSSNITNLYGWYENSNNHISWTTSTEVNNDYFEIQHSTKGYNWQSIGIIQGNGSTNSEHSYRFIHETPSPGTNYYRLTSTDFDGLRHYKGIIQIEAPVNFAYYDQANGILKFENKTSFEIYSMDGKLVTQGVNCEQIEFRNKGAFIIRDLKSNVSQRLLIH